MYIKQLQSQLTEQNMARAKDREFVNSRMVQPPLMPQFFNPSAPSVMPQMTQAYNQTSFGQNQYGLGPPSSGYGGQMIPSWNNQVSTGSSIFPQTQMVQQPFMPQYQLPGTAQFVQQPTIMTQAQSHGITSTGSDMAVLVKKLAKLEMQNVELAKSLQANQASAQSGF